MSRPTSPRPAAVLVSGVATTLYYATPDLISSRTARGWTKAALTAVSLVAAGPELRAAWATARERPEVDGEAVPAITLRSLPAGTRAVVLGSVAAALALSVRGVAAAERWAFRRGQARVAAGKRLPHTGPALVYGALTAGLWYLPEPSDRHGRTGDPSSAVRRAIG